MGVRSGATARRWGALIGTVAATMALAAFQLTLMLRRPARAPRATDPSAVMLTGRESKAGPTTSAATAATGPALARPVADAGPGRIDERPVAMDRAPRPARRAAAASARRSGETPRGSRLVDARVSIPAVAVERIEHPAPVRSPEGATPEAAADGGGDPAPGGATPPRTAVDWATRAYQLKAAHDPVAAAAAFASARVAGFDGQRAALELGYVALEQGAPAEARTRFGEAARGPERAMADQALRELQLLWMGEAYRRKTTGDLRTAALAFRSAQAAGFDRQRVEAELGYVALALDSQDEARGHFIAASSGPDDDLASTARGALTMLPRHVWSDLYADTSGWQAGGAAAGGVLVPTARVRALYRPSLDVDASVYLAAQAWGQLALDASRPLASGADTSGSALLGVGALVRVWDRRLNLFVQAGPAFVTNGQGAARAVTDVRGGAALGLESAKCWPARAQGVQARWAPCAELYSEAVWANRFENDVFAFARGRGGGTLLVTGPVAWGAVGELRATADRLDAPGSRAAVGAVGPRWKLLSPFHLDVVATVGEGVQPRGETFTDLRLQVATTHEF